MSDNRIEIKIDKLTEKLGNIDSTLAAQHVSLKEHMKRSDLLEKQIDVIKKELSPIQKHVFMVTGALKLIGSAGLIITLGKILKLL